MEFVYLFIYFLLAHRYNRKTVNFIIGKGCLNTLLNLCNKIFFFKLHLKFLTGLFFNMRSVKTAASWKYCIDSGLTYSCV